MNICVWCKMAQTDRNRKQVVTKGDDSKLQVSDMMERYYVTKKIGFVRLLLIFIYLYFFSFCFILFIFHFVL